MDPQADEPSSSSGGSPPLLTRRVLLWGGGSLTLLGLGALALGSSTAPSNAPRPPPDEVLARTRLARGAAFAGNLGRARYEAELALKQAPSHAPALFVLACVALEEGRPGELEALLGRLAPLCPGCLEPRLLERMHAHRQRAGTRWRQAFISAWGELGRPNLRDSAPLLERPELLPTDPPRDAWQRASTPTRLALVLSAFRPSEDALRWLVAHLPQLDDAALVIAADNLLRDRDTGAPLLAEAAPVLRAKLAQLAERHPRSLQLHLLSFLADGNADAALGERELAALEALSPLPDWREHSFTRTFQETRRQLQAARHPEPAGAALGVATLSVTDRGSHLLRQRAKATRAQLLPGARERLGRILWSVGARMAEESTLVEHMVGLQFMLKGAEDLGDDAERARVDALVDEAHALLSSEHKAALERWPLPSLQEEVLQARVEAEWARLRDFAGP